MPNINLLPWRETLKQEKKRNFLLLLSASMFMTILCIGVVHMEMLRQTKLQKVNNAYLKQEGKILNKKIKKIDGLQRKKSKLIARMDIIQQLQMNRPQIVRIFNGLATTVPDGLYLVEVSRRNDSINVSGKAESNSRVSKFMRNIEKSAWLESPSLSMIKADEGNKKGIGANGFNLQATQIKVRKQEGLNVIEAK